MMDSGVQAALSLLPPLLGAGFIAISGRRSVLREIINLLAASSLFLIVFNLLGRVKTENLSIFSVLEIIPGLAISFHVEALGLLFALVASVLWIISSFYIIGYMGAHHEENRTRFSVCFALTIAAAIGIAFSGNVFTLFIFYEMMTLVTYPLVTHHGTEQAVRAGRVYLGYLFSTSVAFFLLAVIWTWILVGTLDFSAGGILVGRVGPGTGLTLLALYVFGIGKAALMPFHRWLPAAMVAPAPVSALLHAVAVVKAGVFSIMKVVVYIFGVDFLHDSGLTIWLMYLAGGTILLSSFIALTKDNLKARLAYSTVSQLSYIILGAALANAWGIIGGSMHIVMHAFGKITLFFCAGAIDVACHKTKVSEMTHIGRSMPITMIAFLIGSLSVIGLPPFGGAWSKWYLIMGAVSDDHWPLVAVLMISSLLNIAYLMPVVIRAFFAGSPTSPVEVHIKEAPLFCLIPLCITSAACILLFFFASDIYQFLTRLVQT